MNKPNILSNELDQVPKTRQWYTEVLHDPDLKKQIIDAFEAHDVAREQLGEHDFLVENNDQVIIDWIEKNQEHLPLQMIHESIKNGRKVACEIHRTKKQKASGFTETVGPGVAREDLGLGKVLTRNKEDIKGNIITYLVFQKKKDVPLTAEISIQKVEFPSEGAMLPDWIAFHKELKGEEFIKEHIKL